MKFYIAARFGLKNHVIKLFNLLKDQGHEVVGDWTEHELVKPYEKSKELSEKYAVEDIEGVKNCDVFVIISDEAGTGMYVELGAAILSHLKFGKPKIYVIGEYNSRAMFYFHPSIKHKKDFNEVLEDLKIK